MEGYDGYLFGSPTHFKNTTDAMKRFLFLASQADLARRIGGSFSSHTHIGSGAKVIYDMMEQVIGINMAGLRPFNVKEQILDSGRADRVCLDYGRSLSEKF